MATSTHRVDIVPVVLEKHPNADSLSIVQIFDGGYTCLVRTEDWEGQTIGAYIPPDSIVPDTPDYAFLGGKRRIRARKLRGIWSMGLLMPAPEGSQIGDDVAEQMGVTHYDPPEPPPKLGGATCRAPHLPGFGDPINYDVESFRKYGRKVFQDGEEVWVTEKLHGTNARFVCVGDKMHVGSHKYWKRPDVPCLWLRVLEQYPSLEKYCRDNPDTVVYGEIYGMQKGMKYGLTDGEVRLAVFDIFHKGKWFNAQKVETTCRKNDIPVVPVLGVYHFNFKEFLELAEGDSLIAGANHFREGIVVKPMRERWEARCGRVKGKVQ
jgi:RNA ligase (TIGR02306 family)